MPDDLQLVVFALDGLRCALLLANVERVLPMVAIAPLVGAPDIALGAINVHGHVVAVVDIRARFGLAPREPEPTSQLLLVRTDRRSMAFPVDEVAGVIRCPQERLVPSS